MLHVNQYTSIWFSEIYCCNCTTYRSAMVQLIAPLWYNLSLRYGTTYRSAMVQLIAPLSNKLVVKLITVEIYHSGMDLLQWHIFVDQLL